MKKILLIITLLISSYLLTSCLDIEERINLRHTIFENNDFIIASNEKSNLNNTFYYLIGLSENSKNKETIVFPQKINNIDSTIIGYRTSYFGYDEQNYPFELYKQKNIYLNYFSNIQSYINFKSYNNLKMFIPNDRFYITPKSKIKFLKENNNNNVIYYNINDYKMIDNSYSKYNIKPANTTYYIDDYRVFFIDDIDNSKVNVIPPIPYREDYYFDGWYLDEDYIKKLDFDKYVFPPKTYDINGNYIYNENKIYAKWIEK